MYAINHSVIKIKYIIGPGEDGIIRWSLFSTINEIAAGWDVALLERLWKSRSATVQEERLHESFIIIQINWIDTLER